VGKPENVHAFIQNEKVLAGFQQIRRTYRRTFAGKFAPVADFDGDRIEQRFRSQWFVGALDPPEGIEC
jgi:hypothetical protein